MRRRQALLSVTVVVVVAILAPTAAPASLGSLREETIPAARIAVEVPTSWAPAAPSKALRAQHVVAAFRSPTATAGFRDNLSVIVGPVSPGTTLRSWLLGGEASRYLSLGSLRAFRVHGTHGLAYTSSRLESFRGRPLQIAEYGFFHGGDGYLFTYVSLRRSRALFEASARSIRFLLGPPAA